MTFPELGVAAVLGALLLWMVLGPLLRKAAPADRPLEPEDPAETSRGVALAALRELELDREMGKLSASDYESLKASYTAEAVAALRADAVPDIESLVSARVRALSEPPPAFCSACGSRAEPDGLFCSNCGVRLAA